MLANAAYFNARWQHSFDKKLTQDGNFTTAGGKNVTVPFMRFGEGHDSLPNLPVARTDTYAAVELPYTGGRFAALAIMPTGQPLTAFVASLTPGVLAGVVDSLTPTDVDLRMPRFTLAHYVELNSSLSAMGMPTAFSDGADFSAMSSEPLQIRSVVQRAYLKVDESGTEAAAVSGVEMGPTAMPVEQPPVILDRPFLFLIRDTKTGTVLFAAQVQNPAA